MTPPLMQWSVYVVSLCLLTGVCSSQTSLSQCSMSISREARDILEHEFFPVVTHQSFDLPLGCLLRSERDALKVLEAHKSKLKETRWKCSDCDKVFKSELFLDGHLMRAHTDKVEEVENAVCLADYCDLLRCDTSNTVRQLSSSLCMPKTMARQKAKCRTIVNKCFPVMQSKTSHGLNDLFTRLFCEPLSCDVPTEDRLLREHRSNWSMGRRFFGGIIFTLVVVILMFYVGLMLWKREVVGVSSDLRHTPHHGAHGKNGGGGLLSRLTALFQSTKIPAVTSSIASTLAEEASVLVVGTGSPQVQRMQRRRAGDSGNGGRRLSFE
eukprot:TRINITY_DN983_c0_g1_i2.p1 TRINITY_DN983_c0_g1~~TRINITY_DN983_c0_g1_i2.p1  ORF type:complete len:324 (+),score=35.74 TRINITY_DN983_c0_g1_i2:185-1156(+)